MSDRVDRRGFLGTVAAGSAVLAAGAGSASAQSGWWGQTPAAPGEHVLPELSFPTDGLVLKGSGYQGISQQTVEWHHGRHHAGYVNALNSIEKTVAGMDDPAGVASASTYGDLKRRETFNASGMILHNLYWAQLTPGGASYSPDSALVRKIEADFGSVDRWRNEFVTAGRTASIGWVVLCLSPADRRLHNYVCSLHELGAVWGAVPLLALDVWEHAYYHDYGPDRAAYINNWQQLINWPAVQESFLTAARSV